jgi:hypothetical protein
MYQLVSRTLVILGIVALFIVALLGSSQALFKLGMIQAFFGPYVISIRKGNNRELCENRRESSKSGKHHPDRTHDV